MRRTQKAHTTRHCSNVGYYSVSEAPEVKSLSREAYMILLIFGIIFCLHIPATVSRWPVVSIRASHYPGAGLLLRPRKLWSSMIHIGIAQSEECFIVLIFLDKTSFYHYHSLVQDFLKLNNHYGFICFYHGFSNYGNCHLRCTANVHE